MREKTMAWLKRNACYFLLGAALICLLAGVLRGENRLILEKAIRICLECIGIG